VAGIPFVDQRVLIVPDDLLAGEYTLRAGWYRQDGEQFIRMPARADDVRDDLVLLARVQVE
jgi:hypothetical protein